MVLQVTYHAHRTWFDEDSSKESENIVVQSFLRKIGILLAEVNSSTSGFKADVGNYKFAGKCKLVCSTVLNEFFQNQSKWTLDGFFVFLHREE